MARAKRLHHSRAAVPFSLWVVMMMSRRGVVVALSNPRSFVTMSTDSSVLRKQSAYHWLAPTTGHPLDPFSVSAFSTSSSSSSPDNHSSPPLTGYGSSIQLTKDERELFNVLRRVVRHKSKGKTTTLRVAGGWVRDKLLATPEFQAYHKVFAVGSLDPKRLTSKYRTSSSSHTNNRLGRHGSVVLLASDTDPQPVDIDIALDDMLGREFADHFNSYLLAQGEKTVSVGMMLKNPAKSKHLETATMRVNNFWLDFVNLRAEEYANDSRIPDVMRIGSPQEDAFRRDLTINSLFFNINTGQIEDWTGRGFADLRRGVIATPLPALTTFLDDPLRVLRAIRFAARLRFSMSEELVQAAKDEAVVSSLQQKVSRERIGGEVDRMLRTPDPVGAARLLCNLGLALSAFPVVRYYVERLFENIPDETEEQRCYRLSIAERLKGIAEAVLHRGLGLLATSHDHLADCRWSPPLWCKKTNDSETLLVHDEESRRLLWYAAFLKPLHDDFQSIERPKVSQRKVSKKSNRSIVYRVLVDDVKRPGRDAEAIERIIAAADDFTALVNSGADVSATMIILSAVKVEKKQYGWKCSMSGRTVDSCDEDDPVWGHAMEFRVTCANILRRIGPLWRASMVLAIAQDLSTGDTDLEYCIEGDVMDESREERRRGILERYDAVAASMLSLGLLGIWDEKPLVDGQQMKQILRSIPVGPAFRDVMQEQTRWMTLNPGASVASLEDHLVAAFPEYCKKASMA